METQSFSPLENPCDKVRNTCQRVMDQSSMVKINEDKIEGLLDQIKEQITKSGLAYDKWSDWHIKEPKNFSVE